MNETKNTDYKILTETMFAEKFCEDNFKNIEYITEKQPSVVPLRLNPDEIRRAYKYQKAMLDYMLVQYQNSIGTKDEKQMEKLYNDSVIDFNDFVKKYEDELFE